MPTKRSPAKSHTPAVPGLAGVEDVAPESGPISLPRPLGAWRVFAFMLAFFLPGLGLGLSLLYWQSDARYRRFSLWCLGLAVLGCILAWACGTAWTEMQGSAGGIQPW